jgi:hypothetical protein
MAKAGDSRAARGKKDESILQCGNFAQVQAENSAGKDAASWLLYIEI